MPRVLLFTAAAIVLAASPLMLETSHLSFKSEQPLDAKQSGRCDVDNRTIALAEPQVDARSIESLQLLCSSSELDGVLRLYRYEYGTQTKKFEAVSSSHRFVPPHDLNRYGTRNTDFSWGTTNEYTTNLNEGTKVTVWQWYELNSQIYAAPSKVKILEFVNALLLKTQAPIVYVAQWIPSQDLSIGDAKTAQTLDRILAELAGYDHS